jgi:4-alpha-glucanotransferase
MRPVTLVMILHDHQPVGNFDDVFEHAYARAYDPFLRFLESHPFLRIGLHTSGPLLQWIALHHRDYLSRLRMLVDRGQVELWGGGFFEPILPAISETDRHGQIDAMSNWLELELGRRPVGAWLAERVWEPGLASSLGQAGVGYTALDDAHFVAAGLERNALWGYFETEDQGVPLNLLPIHRELRYTMPFAEPSQTIEMLKRVSELGEGLMAVHGDDGEKFGIWPGTHELCYENGWLERFVEALAAEPWIELRTPAEAIAHHRSRGLVYVPTASYHEMQEWALPPEGQARYHRAAATLRGEFGEDAPDLLRGGHWRNFLVRYPEANRLHKRSLRASRLLHAHPAVAQNGKPFPVTPTAEWKEAQTHLWRAQCNCPYWHGIFGGLYLPHLRSALYRELIALENYVAPGQPNVERADIDMDGWEDGLLETASWAAWVSSRGARMWAFDDRENRWNYGDTLARRPEFYHRALHEAALGVEATASIHASVRAKEPGLAELAEHLDSRERDSFLDCWVEAGRIVDLAGDGFEFVDAGPFDLALERVAGDAPDVRKTYRVSADGWLEVVYVLRSSRPRLGRLEIELNLGLHVADAVDRYVEVEGERAVPPHFAARARHDAISRVAFVDEWAGRRLDLWMDRKCALERAPIETVSLSESGAERVFQGIELRAAFAVALEAGKPWALHFRLAPAAAGKPA